MINGVEIKELVTHPDERGFFRELIRSSDPFFEGGFGQWGQSFILHNVIKAWHLHRRQIDWWYVPLGLLKVALHDLRAESPTRGETMELLLGEPHPPRIVRIPPGVAHGCKVLSGSAHLFYVTSRVYDPSDELRLPHDDPKIGYDWLKRTEIR